MASRLSFDVHCHVMTLARPALGPFLDALARRKMDYLMSQVAAPTFLLFSLLRRGGDAARNFLSVADNDPAGQFMLMEDDLAGSFGPPADPELAVAARALVGRSRDDRWLVCPQAMDFSRPVDAPAACRYPAQPRKPLEEAVREILAGVSAYRRERPWGRLVIRPFLGMDPTWLGPGRTEEVLDRYFRSYAKGRQAQLAAFRDARRWRGNPLRPPRNAFAGVKLYPPLGFDPWPEDRRARDAVRVLYSYCERRGIPITVHCDDQGYRVIAHELAELYTAPERWSRVFTDYPELSVNFAHFGRRYLPAARGDTRERWSRTIVGYMERLPGVYADVAFNGTERAYWNELGSFMAGLSDSAEAVVRRRLLFGSDFLINLTKSQSYLDYVAGFMASGLDQELKSAMLERNPAGFLFGDE